MNSIGEGSSGSPSGDCPETENPVNSPELFDSEQPSTSAQGASYIAITPVLPQQKRKRFKAEKGEFNWGTNYSCLIDLEEKRLKYEEKQLESGAQHRQEE